MDRRRRFAQEARSAARPTATGARRPQGVAAVLARYRRLGAVSCDRQPTKRTQSADRPHHLAAATTRPTVSAMTPHAPSTSPVKPPMRRRASRTTAATAMTEAPQRPRPGPAATRATARRRARRRRPGQPAPASPPRPCADADERPTPAPPRRHRLGRTAGSGPPPPWPCGTGTTARPASRTAGPDGVERHPSGSRTVPPAASPKAPTPGSAITSRRRPRSRTGRRPSALSTNPSKWSIPVIPRSAATTRAAATPAGQARPAAHHTPPRSRPMAAPTGGNQSRVRGPGVRAPPKGVRNDTAARTIRRPRRRRRPQLEDAPGHDQDGAVRDGGDRLVDRPERVTEAAAGLARGMHAQPHLLRDHHGGPRPGSDYRGEPIRVDFEVRGRRHPGAQRIDEHRSFRLGQRPDQPVGRLDRPPLGRSPSPVGRHPGLEVGVAGGHHRGRHIGDGRGQRPRRCAQRHRICRCGPLRAPA